MVSALKRCVLIYCLTASIIPFGLDAWGKPKQKMSRDSRYKINFHEVKVEEFIQFLSEIANLNFVYNPGELNFSINLVSDEEMSLETIVSGFVQTLRIQGFNILEESGTLVIHKNPDIKDLPVLFSGEALTDHIVSPIVTKIYQIKNSPVETIRTLIVPFLSSSSVIETFADRKLLIISDVVQNILSIDSLIHAIDQPDTGSVNASYNTTFFGPAELIAIATPIIDSVCGGKSYSLVPQVGTQRVFIVGSDELIEKTLEIFAQIEERAHKNPNSITSGNIFLHKALYRPIQSIASAIKAVARDSKKSEFNTASFAKLATDVTLIQPDFLLYIGEPVELKKIEGLITTIDSPQQVKSDMTFTIVKLKFQSGKAVIDQLKAMAKEIPNLSENSDFFDSVENLRWNKQTNSIVIQGSTRTIQEITDFISKIDTQELSKFQQFIYTPKTKSAAGLVEQVKISTKEISSYDSTFAHMIDNMQIVDGTIVATASPENLQKLQQMLESFDQKGADNSSSTTQYFIYKPTHMTAEELRLSLEGIGRDLEHSNSADLSLIQSIRGIKLVKNSSSIIVSGSDANIAKLKEMIASLDQQGAQPASKIAQVGATTFLSYQPKVRSAKELLEQLKTSTKDVKTQDPELYRSVTSAKIVDNTLVFSGNPENLDKIDKLLISLDQKIPGVVTKKAQEKYQNYKPVYKTGPDLIKETQGYVEHISAQGVDNHSLSNTVDNMHFLNGRIIIVGSQENVDQVMKLLQEFDTPNADLAKPTTTIESFDNIGFLNYKLNFHLGSDIQDAIKLIGQELQLTKNQKNEALVNAISSVQWIKVTNSLIATGDPQTLGKLKEILESIDVPLKQVFIEVLVLETTKSNVVDIGLRWGGYSNLKGRVASYAANNPRVDSTNQVSDYLGAVSGSGATTAGSSSNGVNALNGASPNLFPSISAGQLGVIGDIIFHGGRSYLTLASLLTALQEEGTITIVLNQKILAQDSRMSQIFVGQNIPFTGSIITTSGISQTTNANLEYRNIGVSLNITPNIGDNGIVTIEIDEEITEEAGTGTQGASVNTQQVNGIRTTKTSMQTRVHVPDKAFVVLSGQIRDTKTKSKSGLPCLGGLPVIGAAFQQSTTDYEVSDVLIFIRPEIIQTSEQWKELSEEQADLVSSRADTESVDEGIDFVKKDH
ncbi:MAG: hypothetical protein ACOYK9_03600 [Chlamydiia bacterium]